MVCKLILGTLQKIISSDEKLYEEISDTWSWFAYATDSSECEWQYEKSTSRCAVVSEVCQDKLTKTRLNSKNKIVKTSKVFHELGSLYRKKVQTHYHRSNQLLCMMQH